MGIEKFYEDQLHGVTGFEEVEINNRGKVIRKLRDQAGVAGSSIRLSIDVELQQYVMSLIAKHKGAVVVLDPRDSSILAMVSNPSYDNNLFVGGISGRIIKHYWTIQPDHFIAVLHKALIHRLQLLSHLWRWQVWKRE